MTADNCCDTCGEKLSLRLSGAILCGCQRLDRHQPEAEIPRSWHLTGEELRAERELTSAVLDSIGWEEEN
jgi:hypothetical protein